MRLILFILFTTFLFAITAYSQDILYTTAGNKLLAKVLEINTKDIKYKDFNNIEGPTYVISKTDIVLIQYSNGVTEVINDNPQTISPKATEQAAVVSDPIEKIKTAEKKEFNLYYLNNNMLSINALALANGDVTLIYDRDLLDSHLSLSFLGGYNFNSRAGGLNLFIVDSKDKAKKKYDAGFGINFMPKNTKRVQYFVGLLVKYMAYEYQNVVDTSNNQKNYQTASASQTAIMVTNGWIYKVSPNFNFKLFISLGGQINSTPLETINSNGIKSDYSNYPKMYLGYCFGYRF